VVASFAIAVKAPPIPVARGPTGIVKKFAAVVPTFVWVYSKPVKNKIKDSINVFFILNSK
jgi:hypothetical protein